MLGPPRKKAYKKRRNAFKCRNCGLGWATSRQMLSHRNYCVVEDAAPNAVFDNYTASEFNREMNRGNINPHRIQRSHAFKNQLHDIGPIRDMISTDSQDNESSSVQELPPMNVMTDMPDTYQPDESEDEAINEQDLDSENDDDMNLDGQDRDVEERKLYCRQCSMMLPTCMKQSRVEFLQIL